jgi:hypothetical protein
MHRPLKKAKSLVVRIPKLKEAIYDGLPLQ